MERKTTIVLLLAGMLAVSGCGLFEDGSDSGRAPDGGESSAEDEEEDPICEYPGAAAQVATFDASDKLEIEGAIRAHNRAGCRIESDADWRHVLIDLPAISCEFHGRPTEPEPVDALAAVRVGLGHTLPDVSERELTELFGVERDELAPRIEAVFALYARGEISAEQESLANAYITPIMDVLRCNYGPSYVAELTGTDSDVFMEHHTARLYEHYLGRTRDEAVALADDHELADESAAFTTVVQTRRWDGRRHALVIAGREDGLPQTRLGARDFEVREDGEPLAAELEVASLGAFAREHADAPALSVAFLHRGRAPRDGRREALDDDAIMQFVALLPATTTASVTSTKQGVSYHLEPTDSRLELRRALDRARDGDEATKYDALAAMLEGGLDEDARFQLVLDTSMRSGWDSRDQCYESVVERAKAKGIPIFGVAYGDVALGDAARLATYTDGCMVYAPGRQSIRAELAELALYLNQAYIVSWESDATGSVSVGRGG